MHVRSDTFINLTLILFVAAKRKKKNGKKMKIIFPAALKRCNISSDEDIQSVDTTCNHDNNLHFCNKFCSQKVV